MTTTSQSYSLLGFWVAPLSRGDGAAGGGGTGFAADSVFGASDPSSIRMGEPLDTLSPTLTFNSFTVPAPGDGISIVALSDSRVMRDCSLVTLSPGLTRTSMTSTLLKSPMSGTLTSLLATRGSACGCRTAPRRGSW